MKRTVLLAILLGFAMASHGQQYKWRDENGRVRYGDVPPPGVKATPLRPPPPPSSAPAAKSFKERDAEFRKRQQEAEKAREKQELAAQQEAARQEDCARAQEYLRALEAGVRIQRTDAKGERYYLDDAQRAQETQRARQAVSSCK